MSFRFPTHIIAGLGLVTSALGQTDKPAIPLVVEAPRVPAIGIELTGDVRTQLRKQTDALGLAIDALTRLQMPAGVDIAIKL